MEVEGSGLSQMFKSDGEEAVISRLQETLEDVNEVKSDGTTLLHLFAMLGSYKVVQYLWDHGARPTILTLDNSTVLHSALRNSDDKDEVRAKILELFLRGQRDRECESSGSESANLDVDSADVFKPLDVNHQNDKGWTALKIAARKKMEKCVDVLIQYNADPDLPDNEHYTPLHNSVESPQILKLLALKSSNINARNNQGETALFVACDRGHSRAALVLLEHKADPNVSDNTGISPLFIAARNGNEELVRSLVKSGACVNQVGGTQKIGPLHWAAHKELVDIAVLLIENEGDILLKDNEGRTPLSMASPALAEKMIANTKLRNPAFDQGQGPAGMSAKEKAMTACCGGNVPALAALFKSGEVSVNMRSGKTKPTLLHMAAYCGQIHVVMYLLQEGADLKLKDSENDSVLHFACMKALPQGRHDSTLEFLLTTLVPSDILNSQNSNGDTPLLVAVRCGFVKRALLLLKHKADPLIGNNKQELPLHRSCSDESNMELVMSLVETTDVNLQDNDGWTPLMFACKASSSVVVRYLLQRGADPNIAQTMGFTALYLAAQEDSPHICELLLENGADPNVQGGPQKLTPLHLAAHSNHLAVCCILAEHGADISVKDVDGDTPLNLGREESRAAILAAHKKWLLTGQVGENSQSTATRNSLSTTTNTIIDNHPNNSDHQVAREQSIDNSSEPNNETPENVATLKEKVELSEREIVRLRKEKDFFFEEYTKLQTVQLSTTMAMTSLNADSMQDNGVDLNKVQRGRILYQDVFRTISSGWFGELEVCVVESKLYKAGQEFDRSVELLRRLHCPYIAIFLGVFDDPTSTSHGILMEAMNVGPLTNFIRKKDISATWKQQLRMALDVACGLCYVHNNGLIYKHLLPTNILLSENLRAKLSVEGFVADCMDQQHTPHGNDAVEDSVGTSLENFYQAPEVLDGSSHTKASDVYSFSLIMYEIASRQFVYINEDGSEQDAFKFTFKTIMGSRPAFPGHIPSDYIDIATKGWQRDLIQRPSLSCTVQELKKLFINCN